MASNFLVVALGGAVGSVSRYALGLWARGFLAFPVGTLIVNVVGCFFMGFCSAYAERWNPQFSLFLMTGLLGGFTTFSAFGFETLLLVERQQYAQALLNVGANLVLGFGAVALGRYFV